MRILFADALINRKKEGPRAALVSLTSTLRNVNVDVQYHPFVLRDEDTSLTDFRKEEEQFAREVAQESKDCNFLFISGWTGAWDRMKYVAQVAKEINPMITVVAGGPHIDFTEMYRRHLGASRFHVLGCDAPHVDHFVYGESEETIIELIEKGPKETPGVAYRDNDKIVLNDWRRLRRNLDDLPFPKLTAKELNGKSWAYVETARGCPYRCDFCAEPKKWSDPTGATGIYRRKTPERVAAEIEYYSQNGIKHIRFTDSTLTLNKNLGDICDLIIGRKIQITWSGFARVNEIVLSAPLGKMRESGCETLLVGFESGSAGELLSMKKGYRIEQAYTTVRLLKERGIKIRGSWIVGHPGQTDDDFRATIQFAQELGIDAHAIHAYEDQGGKFRNYQFGTLDFSLDMPPIAFGELVRQLTSPQGATEMHYLPRVAEMPSRPTLSKEEWDMVKKIERFNIMVARDKTYDVRDRFDRNPWEAEH